MMLDSQAGSVGCFMADLNPTPTRSQDRAQSMQWQAWALKDTMTPLHRHWFALLSKLLYGECVLYRAHSLGA